MYMNLQNRKRHIDLESEVAWLSGLRSGFIAAGEEGIARNFGKVMYTLLHFKWIAKTCCITHGTLFNIVHQPGWEGALG